MSAPSKNGSLDLEARISRLSAQQRAALVSRLAEPGGPRGGSHSGGLAAFVTIDAEWDGLAPTPEELRAHLQSLVPEHMVPSSIRVLEGIPRLPNGKVDTAGLVQLPDELVGQDWVEPRNEVEKKLADIWCEVLQVDQVGVHDPFFEVGGDSILSIHVTSRANQQGLGLSPNDIFNFPTIAELAMRCAASRPEHGDDAAAGPAATDPATDPTPARNSGRPPLFMVQWGAKEAAQLRQHLGPEQPLFCFAAHWHGAYLRLSATVEQMAEERLAELRRLQPTGPYFIGGYSMGVPIALEMAQQLRRQGESVPLLFVLDPPQRNREDESLSVAPRRTLLQKLSRQVRALVERPPREWMGHLHAETKAQLRHRVIEPLKLASVGAMRRVGLRVPHALWHHYVGTVYLRARSRYAHPPYEGDVVVFGGSSSAATETLSSWRELVGGNLHVETFEGTHLDLTMDPELFARWAQRLRVILTDRQSVVRQPASDQPFDSHVRASVRRTTTSESPSTASAAR